MRLLMTMLLFLSLSPSLSLLLLKLTFTIRFSSSCTSCTPARPRRYCNSSGLTEVTGDCLAGYYCSSRAIVSNPVNQSYGGRCTTGHYCEEASPWPEPCPTGTYFEDEVCRMWSAFNAMRGKPKPAVNGAPCCSPTTSFTVTKNNMAQTFVMENSMFSPPTSPPFRTLSMPHIIVFKA